MAMKFNTVKCQLNTFCSSCAFPFFISWCFVALFYFKGSGQRVLMAQTLMLYAGHMTKTSLPQLMILAKCTCSLTPVPSQGWVFLFLFLFFYCEICHSIKSYSVKHFFSPLICRLPAISMVGIAAMWPMLPFSKMTVIFFLLVGKTTAFFNGCWLSHIWAILLQPHCRLLPTRGQHCCA